MECELCSSGKRLPKQKLCEACIEAITRLWAISEQNEGMISSIGTDGSDACLGATPAALPTVAKV